MPRTDIHRPGAAGFDPQAYELIEVYAKPAKTMLDDFVVDYEPSSSVAYRTLMESFARDGVHLAAHQRPGYCGHCGTPLIYFAVLLHVEANELILVGETCLDDRFTGMTAARFARLRAMAAADRRRALALRRAEELAWDWHPFAADLTYPQVTDAMGGFVAEVGEKFRASGQLSERQCEALERVFSRHLERENDRQAHPDPDPDPAPVVEGKIVVTGKIAHVRRENNPFAYHASTWKFLVIDDRGFKVWGTMPAALRADVDDVHILRGRRVEFTATVKRSGGDDETFGIAARPTKARLLTAA